MKNSPLNPTENNFWRRVAAIIYDWFLLIAVILVAVSLFTLSIDLIYGADTAHHLLKNPMIKILYQLYLLGVGVLFYTWFWTHGGQTLGMKVWKIKIVNADLQTLKRNQALFRLSLAIITCLPLGLGLLWSVFSKDKRTLYEKWTNTYLIQVSSISE